MPGSGIPGHLCPGPLHHQPHDCLPGGWGRGPSLAPWRQRPSLTRLPSAAQGRRELGSARLEWKTELEENEGKDELLSGRGLWGPVLWPLPALDVMSRWPHGPYWLALQWGPEPSLFIPQGLNQRVVPQDLGVHYRRAQDLLGHLRLPLPRGKDRPWGCLCGPCYPEVWLRSGQGQGKLDLSPLTLWPLYLFPIAVTGFHKLCGSKLGLPVLRVRRLTRV